MTKKLAGLLGLLNRGGKLLIGNAIPERLNGISLLIYAKDASHNTLTKYVDRAIYLVIPTIEVESKKELGDCIGYPEISIIAVKDKNAAKGIKLAAEKGEL